MRSSLLRPSVRPSVVLLGALAVIPAAQAKIYLGEGEITLSSGLSATYDSNLEGRSNGEDAYYLSISPDATYTRPNALLETTLSAGLNYDYFLTDRDTFSDREAYFTSAELELPQGVFGNYFLNGRVAYTESYRSDPDVNVQLFTASRDATINGGIGLTSRLSANARASYEETRAREFSGNESWTAGTGLVYLVGQRSSLNASYNYRETSASRSRLVSQGLDQRAHSFVGTVGHAFLSGVNAIVGANYTRQKRGATETLSGRTELDSTNLVASLDGPFLPPRMFPKLKSSFSIAYGSAEAPGLYDEGDNKQLTGSLRLSWQARERTSVNTSVTRSRALSVDNRTVEETNAQLGVGQEIGRDWSTDASFGYRWRTLKGLSERDTESFIFRTSAGRSFGATKEWGFRTSYEFEQNTSSAQVAEFDHHRVIMTLRYTY